MSLSRPRRKAQIGVTPLIDVVFILLVFFMLASRFEDWRSVDLASSSRGVPVASSAEGALLVEVRLGDLRLSGATMTDDALLEAVRDRLSVRPDQRLLVAPAVGVDIQRVVGVLDDLAAAGATDISLLGRF
ncbi:MAG: biopolymer transporter ExbD [Pseudomonadota bacterium]